MHNCYKSLKKDRCAFLMFIDEWKKQYYYIYNQNSTNTPLLPIFGSWNKNYSFWWILSLLSYRLCFRSTLFKFREVDIIPKIKSYYFSFFYRAVSTFLSIERLHIFRKGELRLKSKQGVWISLCVSSLVDCLERQLGIYLFSWDWGKKSAGNLVLFILIFLLNAKLSFILQL
jgi:hypothetical protein